MTNFEKFKEDLTIWTLVKLISGSCYNCPIRNDKNNCWDNCINTLKEYLEQEVESEVENDKI